MVKGVNTTVQVKVIQRDRHIDIREFVIITVLRVSVDKEDIEVNVH